jgi:hypothetical protein
MKISKYHFMEYMGSGGVAPPLLISALEEDKRFASLPGRFTQTKEPHVPIGLEAGWVPVSVWTL